MQINQQPQSENKNSATLPLDSESDETDLAKLALVKTLEDQEVSNWFLLFY